MSSTSSPNFWQNLRDNTVGLAIDYARAKYVDVETKDDDKNITDMADLRYWGQGDPNGTGLVTAPGGIPLVGWLLIAGVIVGGVFLARKL